MPRKRKVAKLVEDTVVVPPVPLKTVRAKKRQPIATAKAAPSAMNKPQAGTKKNASLNMQRTMPPIQETPNKRNPMFIIFEKAQQNESLHGKYIKELIHICNNVSIYSSLICVAPA